MNMAEGTDSENKPFKNIWKLLKERYESHASDLHKAAYENDLTLLRKCLEEKNLDIDLENERGQTALYIATEKKHKEIVKLLIENKAKVQTENCNAIFVAYDVDIIELLEAAGADINSRDVTGNTPFLKAVQMTNYDAVEFYLEKKINIQDTNFDGESCLHMACNVELSFEVVGLLVKRGASINAKDNVRKTPLHHACQIPGTNLKDTKDVIQMLVEHGASLTGHDLKGYCPIHYLIENFYMMSEHGNCFLEILKIMGPNEDALQLRTTIGKSVLHIAAEYFIPEPVLQYMISHGCSLNATDGQMKTPLHYCAFSHHCLEMSKIFMSSGSNVSVKDKWGNTSLHIGAGRRDEIFVKHLIQSGADFSDRNGNGQEAIHIAAAEGCVGIVKLLIDVGANIQSQDNSMSTPLHFAAWANHAHVSQCLVDSGADPKVLDSLKETPFQTALFAGAYGALEVLSTFEKVPSTTSNILFSNYADKAINLEEFQEILSSHSSIQRTTSDRNTSILAYLKEVLVTPSVGTACIDEEFFEVQRDVENLMLNILNAIAKLDGRFRCTLLHAGSTSENTKVRFPNEFDFMFCLEEFSDICHPLYKTETETLYVESVSTKEGCSLYERFETVQPQTKTSSIADYVQVCLNEGDKAAPFREFASDFNLIPCHTIFIIFSQLLEQVVFAKDFPLNLRLTVKEITTHPALQLQWTGSRYKSLNISVDIVPAIRLKELPQRSCLDTILLTDDIRNIPAIVVPKLPTFQHIDLWRCSFALHETAIFRKLLPRIRNSYIVAKALLSSRVCPLVSFDDYEDELMVYKLQNKIDEADDTEDIILYENSGDMVPSYILKMCFLSAVDEKAERSGLETVYMNKEEYMRCNRSESTGSEPGSHLRYGPAEIMNVSHFDVASDVDVDLVSDIFRRCEEHLNDAFVPSFFNPEHNVLGSRALDQDLLKIHSFIRYIRKLLT